MSQVDVQKGLLAGQVAVVTGSTQGIGGGVALKLAESGRADSRAWAREPARRRRKDCRVHQAAGSQALLVTGELQDESHCRSIIRSALSRFGRVDILVNNAGVVASRHH